MCPCWAASLGGTAPEGLGRGCLRGTARAQRCCQGGVWRIWALGGVGGPQLSRAKSKKPLPRPLSPARGSPHRAPTPPGGLGLLSTPPRTRSNQLQAAAHENQAMTSNDVNTARRATTPLDPQRGPRCEGLRDPGIAATRRTWGPRSHRARLRSRPGRDVRALQILAVLLWQRRGCGHPARLPRGPLLAALASTRTASPHCPRIVPTLSPCHPRPPARAPQSPGGCRGCQGAQGTHSKGSPAGCPPPSPSPYGGSETRHDPGRGAEQHLLPFVTARKSDLGGGGDWIGLPPPRAAFPRSSARRDGDSRAVRLCWGRTRRQSPKRSRPASPRSPHHTERGQAPGCPRRCSGDSANSPRCSRVGVL